jgi:hypothetical protein
MELNWVEKEVGDGDGGRFHMHYLVNTENQQCLATITEPRFGGLIYQTDLRIGGCDRSWMTLEAAQGYCESNAEMENIREAAELAEKLHESEKSRQATRQPIGD